MSDRERRTLLSQICGVISEHTKKVCGKSTKCSQHSDEQKKGVRDLYLTEAVDPCLENLQVCQKKSFPKQFNQNKNPQIDVDTCEDDAEGTKESLTRSWEAENSNTSSPADSASTSSSSSKKRDKSSYKSKKDL